MKVIFKIFVLLIFSNAWAGNQNPLEYTASIERSCPFSIEEFEAMIEGAIQSGNIMPVRVEKINREVMHLSIKLQCNRISVIENKYTLKKELTDGRGMIYAPNNWVIKNKNGSKLSENRAIIKARVNKEVTSLLRGNLLHK